MTGLNTVLALLESFGRSAGIFLRREGWAVQMHEAASSPPVAEAAPQSRAGLLGERA